MNARGLKVGLAKRVELTGLDVPKHIRVDKTPIAPAFGEDAVNEHWYIRQFGGTFDERVTGEDLFDKRRACTRKSDDEYRIGRFVAGPGQLTK